MEQFQTGSSYVYNEQSSSTAPATMLDWTPLVAAAMVALSACTTTPHSKSHKNPQGPAPLSSTTLSVAQRPLHVMAPLTPQDSIAKIRGVFSPTVTDIAMAFAVSRQAVYNWLKGDPIDNKHLQRLNDLACAADIVLESGLPVTGWLLKRKIFDGKSILEAVRDGSSARTLAHQFVQVVTMETSQRSTLAKRLAGRTSVARSPESNFQAENDAEA